MFVVVKTVYGWSVLYNGVWRFSVITSGRCYRFIDSSDNESYNINLLSGVMASSSLYGFHWGLGVIDSGCAVFYLEILHGSVKQCNESEVKYIE